MNRTLVIAFMLWIALGGCSFAFSSCPFESQARHGDCCPRNQSASQMTLSGCSLFVAVKVAEAKISVPATATAPMPVLHALPQPVSEIKSLLLDQHGRYLTISILRV